MAKTTRCLRRPAWHHSIPEVNPMFQIVEWTGVRERRRRLHCGERVAVRLGMELLDSQLITRMLRKLLKSAPDIERYHEHGGQVRGGIGSIEKPKAWAIAAGVALEDARFFDADRTAELVEQCIAQAGVAGNCAMLAVGPMCVAGPGGCSSGFDSPLGGAGGACSRSRRTRAGSQGSDWGTHRERASYIRSYYGCE